MIYSNMIKNSLQAKRSLYKIFFVLIYIFVSCSYIYAKVIVFYFQSFQWKVQGSPEMYILTWNSWACRYYWMMYRDRFGPLPATLRRPMWVQISVGYFYNTFKDNVNQLKRNARKVRHLCAAQTSPTRQLLWMICFGWKSFLSNLKKEKLVLGGMCWVNMVSAKAIRIFFTRC